jgi:hypothetical protein
VKRVLREPALQLWAGATALLMLTWPLLVLDRPLHVFIAFFLIWALIIAGLYAIAWAHGEQSDPEAEAEAESRYDV